MLTCQPNSLKTFCWMFSMSLVGHRTSIYDLYVALGIDHYLQHHGKVTLCTEPFECTVFHRHRRRAEPGTPQKTGGYWRRKKKTIKISSYCEKVKAYTEFAGSNCWGVGARRGDCQNSANVTEKRIERNCITPSSFNEIATVFGEVCWQ